MNLNGQIMNELFLEKIASDPEKVAEAAGSYIRTRLREDSFHRKIMRPTHVTRADCQRSVDHDQLEIIVDIEPGSKAMSINIRGEAPAKYVMGQRYAITFGKVTTEKYQKQEDELLAYQAPILDLIEKNAVVDMQTIEDELFIRNVNTALASNGKSAVYNGSAGYTGVTMDKYAFIQLVNLLNNSGGTFATPASTTTYSHDFDTKRYKTDCILMNEHDFNLMLDWAASDVGDGFATSTIIDGYKYSTLMGKKIIVTNKGELVPRGLLYGFAAKEYFGHSFILNDTRFFIKKDTDIVSWSAQETIGMGFGNIYAMARVYATA